MPFTIDEVRELPNVISQPRFATYLQAANNNTQLALELYQWNLEISAAFIVPLQMCEVAARNGVVLALESIYGHNWHLSQSFIQSLPRQRRGYCSHTDFVSTCAGLQRKRCLTAGKLVADLKFAFWENMLTSRHDQRLWQQHFRTSFPHADNTMPYYDARLKANQFLEKVRRLRNRIAHHEPIFNRTIIDDYERIRALIHWRSPTSADWIDKVQSVILLNGQKPIP